MVGGFNAYPAEIEAILRGHEAVAQVAVVGVPDERHGRGGLRLCRPRPDAAAGDPVRVGPVDPELVPRAPWPTTKSHAASSLVDALPVNASGKVLKRELRERYADGVDSVVTSES